MPCLKIISTVTRILLRLLSLSLTIGSSPGNSLISLLNAETARTLASKNLLADMQSMIDGDSEFNADDYLKVFYDQGVDESGKVFGLPAYVIFILSKYFLFF